MGWLVVAGIAAGACGDDAGASGVDGSKRMNEVSEAELGRLCDWANEQSGGYGRTIPCTENMDVLTDTSREDCVMQDAPAFAACSATVAEYEACTLEIAKDLCTFEAALTRDVCAPILACLQR
jgi:hypothetical protein